MGRKKQINTLDLFAGAGGFSQGMEDAGMNVVAAVEFNKKIAETYKYNHDNTHLIVDDIRNVSASNDDPICNDTEINIADIFKNRNLTCDIIFGGPPCQGFSMAGNRIRSSFSFLEDERNYLFKEFIRMVKYLNPIVFIIENVPGILNYNGGKVKNEIFSTFNKLGYDIQAKVLCAADYGVPQMRKRAIFIGNRINFDSQDLFPPPSQPFNSKGNYTTIREAISDLPIIEAGCGIEETPYSKFDDLSDYQRKLRSQTGVVFNHISSHHKPETLEILSMIKEGQTMKDLPEKYKTKSVHSGAYGRMVYDMPSYTLTTRLNTPSVGRITHPIQNRTITPREAARIQSFPDKYRFIGDITSIGMQIGNAVPPLLAESIGRHILSIINNRE